MLQEVKMATAVKKVSNATTIRFGDDYTRQVIDMAAELLNQTRTSFLLAAARERAETVIKERKQTMGEIKTLMLSPAASLDIAKTLDNPPKPNNALKKAMKDYEQANISAIFCVVDRRGAGDTPLAGGLDRLPLFSAAKLSAENWEPSDCPLCRQGLPFVKPGSRKQ
jgi:uncharacterized protein (DUF1778 family)